MPERARYFVILRHIWPPGMHWDLLLDRGQALTAWQLKRNPLILVQTGATAVIPARRIADHRRFYLHYQGAVSQDRGHVYRIDRGRYHLSGESEGCQRLILEGKLLRGEFLLVSLECEPGNVQRRPSQADYDFRRRRGCRLRP